MFNTSETDRKRMISDLLKAMTVAIVSHVMKSQVTGKPMFDDEFIYSLLFTLAGFAAYHIITVNLIPHGKYWVTDISKLIPIDITNNKDNSQ